jgi:hypothetical protein
MQNDQGCFGIPRKQNPLKSELLLTGATSGGSTNSQVLYYPTVVKNTLGSDVSLINSSAMGSVITIGTAGTYCISFRGGASAGIAFGLITVNKAVGTSSGITGADSSIVASMIIDANGTASSCSATLVLFPGDIIQTSWGSGGSYNGINAQTSLRVVRLS